MCVSKLRERCAHLRTRHSSSNFINTPTGWKRKRRAPPTTQELVVGSSAEMETKSTHPPVAVQTSPPTTIQPADASTLPLPATRDKAKWKEIMEMFDRFVQDLWEFEKCMLAMNQCEETEEGVHPSETPLCGQHDNQTKAQRPEEQQKPDSQVLSKPVMRIKGPFRAAVSLPVRLDFSESPSSHPLKDVATADDVSVLSSDSWEKEKMSPPTTQGLVVGSSAEMETKSTHLPVAVQTSSPATIQPADTSAPPLPATEDEATRKERNETFRSALDKFRTYEKLQAGESSSSDLKKDSGSRKKEKMSPPTTQELVVGSSAEMETKSTYPPVAVQTSPPTTIQPADTSAPPLPATEDEATRKERSETFRRALDTFRTYENRLDFSESPSSHPLKDVATADDVSVLSSDSGLDPGESSSSYLKKDLFRSSDSRCVSRKEKAHSYHCDIDFKKNPDHKCAFRPASLSVGPDFGDSLFSHPLKDVATADRYSVLSLDSWLGSRESLPSYLKKASFWSSDSQISLGSRASSVSSCVSNQSKRSIDRDFDFKKKLGSLESLSSDLKKDSFQSSDSGISLERKVSSGSIDMSRKRRKTESESCAYSITFKKKK